jgi:dienelactone hydrolase
VTRNQSIQRFFEESGQNHQPRFRFGTAGNTDFKSWKQQLLPAVLDSLGAMPESVPLNPQVLAEWEKDGLKCRNVLIDLEPGLSAQVLLYWPANASGRLPGLLACHGHGLYGMAAVMGDDSTPEQAADIKKLNYNYGEQMARRGYAVIAIDWRGFGLRDDRRMSPAHDYGKRDLCNLNFIRAVLLGRTLLGMDVHDGRRALDYLCEQPFVDPQRIGVMGLSFGGTMTVWMTLADPRIKAADVICYSDRFAAFALRNVNFCGSQITPGLFALCDMPDLQGLIAPRPLLVEIGAHDLCFRIEPAMSCYRAVEEIYQAAGAADRLELDLFEGNHAWGDHKSAAFFKKHLQDPAR